MRSARFTGSPVAGIFRPVLLVCLGVILYVIANTSGSGWLYVISAGMVAVTVLSVAFLPWNVRGLAVSRCVSHVGTAGESLECVLEVRNENRLPRYLLEIEDAFAGGTGWGALVRIGAGESVEVAYEIPTPRRGVYTAGTVKIESAAPFGLVRARRRIEVASETTVVPRTFDVVSLPDSSAPYETGETSESLATHRGQGDDFWGVREYRPGDPARLIAWRGSARSLASGRLSVVEMSRQTSPPLTVALDLDPLAPEEAREMIVSAAASIALRALSDGRAVVADAGMQRHPFPENPDAEDILTWCASLEAVPPPKRSEATVRIVPSLKSLAGRDLRADIVVLVSCRDFAGSGDFMTGTEERQFVNRLRREGARVVVLGGEFPLRWSLV